MARIKQYIVLRPDISPAVACIGCSHGVLAAYLRWKDEPIVTEWLKGPFYKVICQAVDMDEWKKLLEEQLDKVVITESKLDNLAIAIVYKPVRWDKEHPFNAFKLYGG